MTPQASVARTAVFALRVFSVSIKSTVLSCSVRQQTDRSRGVLLLRIAISIDLRSAERNEPGTYIRRPNDLAIEILH